MIEEKIKNIADTLGCDLKIDHFFVEETFARKRPVVIYYLELNYKETLIKLKYEFGIHNLAEIKVKINTNKFIPTFKVESKSHLSRLFTKKSNIWSVKGAEKGIETKIKEILNSSGLSQLADEVSFLPTINGTENNKEFNVFIHFYLGFERKEESILPIIEFCKSTIDLSK